MDILNIIFWTLAGFGGIVIAFLAFIGFKVVVHAFMFASAVGIASARAKILARAPDEVKEKFVEKPEEDKPSA